LNLQHTQLYVNHEWVEGEKSLDVINPATEETIIPVSYGTANDARTALEAAQRALPEWKALTVYDRSAKLRKIADLMREHVEDLATLLTLEQGKPLAESRGETLTSAATFEWFAEEAKRAYGRTIPSSFPNKRLRLCENSEARPYVGVEREQRHSILELDDQFFDFSHRLVCLRCVIPSVSVQRSHPGISRFSCRFERSPQRWR
jgi:hypothetical protein